MASKNIVTLKCVRSHSRSLEMAPFDRSHMSFYSCSLQLWPYLVPFWDKARYGKKIWIFHTLHITNENSCIKKYVLSNSESAQCNFFCFDHVSCSQLKICCCVQNFMKIQWFFTEVWRYIDFQNGGRPPSWNCFTTTHTQVNLYSVHAQLPVKFHVNLIHRSEDIAVWIFRIFGLKCLFRSPKWGFWGTLDP